MKRIAFIMGMPVILEIIDSVPDKIFDDIFSYLRSVDEQFSTFKKTSEITKINEGKIKKENFSKDMNEIFRRAEQTKRETDGYFDINSNGTLDPSGIVKGWAIHNAADKLRKKGIKKFYLEIAGDIEVSGGPWNVGIRNPFNKKEIVKVVHLTNRGIATSGNYERGDHIHNPKTGKPATDIASMTVIGPDVYEADRFATPAFAMGGEGIAFIGRHPQLAGYMIDRNGIATYTETLKHYL